MPEWSVPFGKKTHQALACWAPSVQVNQDPSAKDPLPLLMVGEGWSARPAVPSGSNQKTQFVRTVPPQGSGFPGRQGANSSRPYF